MAGGVSEKPQIFAEDTVTIIAGPCSIETTEQMNEVGAFLKEQGFSWMRGGAYKPRTSPYAFQGLEERGLDMLRETGDKYDLKVITEVTDSAHAEKINEKADALQIGTRNMANFSLLKKVGEATAKSHKPILFKRGMAATIDEWLSASEYITMSGNSNVILCERGIRTFEPSTRFTLDISAVPVINKRSLLPVCVDVSHPVGQSDLVPAVAKAAVAAGADALMIEVHPNPAEALCDGAQSLNLDQFDALLKELRPIAAAVGKTIA